MPSWEHLNISESSSAVVHLHLQYHCCDGDDDDGVGGDVYDADALGGQHDVACRRVHHDSHFRLCVATWKSWQ